MGYIDLTLMKNILGIDGTGLDDLITFFIDSATESVKNIIGRDVLSQEVIFSLQGNDSNVLYLDEKPITSLVIIELNGVDITSDVTVVEDGHALYYPNGFTREYDYITKKSPYSNESYNKKEKKYNIDIDAFTGFSSVPTDIQNVVSRMVQGYYVESGICQQIKKQSDENEFGKSTTEYFDIEPEFIITEEDMRILLKYR